MKYLVTIMFFLMFLNGIEGQVIDTSKVNNVDSISIVEKNYENINFEALYDSQKAFTSSILSTVYFALSSILIVILAIIGSNIYFNFKFNKKKYDELEKDLINNIDIKIIDFEKNVDIKIDKIKENIIKENNDSKKELIETYNERLDSYSTNLKEQISTLKERIENDGEANKINYENLLKIISDKTSELTEIFKDLLHYDSTRLEIRSLELEAEIWKSQGILSITLDNYIEQAQKAISIKWFWHMKYSLPKIIELLNDMKEIDRYTQRHMDELLVSIPEEYAEQKVKIEKLYKVLRTEKK